MPRKNNHRDTEDTEVAQRNSPRMRLFGQSQFKALARQKEIARMKIPRTVGLLIGVAILATASTAFSQENDAARDKTRERLNALLQRVGPDLGVPFKPSSKSQYVFTGVMRDGLKNCDSFEI